MNGQSRVAISKRLGGDPDRFGAPRCIDGREKRFVRRVLTFSKVNAMSCVVELGFVRPLFYWAGVARWAFVAQNWCAFGHLPP